MNAPTLSEKLPIEQVPGYQAEVNRRTLKYVEEHWNEIEESTIEENRQRRAEFQKKLRADLEAEYKAGLHLNWGK